MPPEVLRLDLISSVAFFRDSFYFRLALHGYQHSQLDDGLHPLGVVPEGLANRSNSA